MVSAYTALVLDSVATSTTESANATFAVSITETNPIITVEQAVALFVASVTESVAIAEASLATLIMTITESMAATDSTTVGTYYIQFIEEIAALSDSNQTITSYRVNRSETMAITSTESGRNLWEVIDDTQGVTWQNISNPQTPGWTAINNTETPGWTPISTR